VLVKASATVVDISILITVIAFLRFVSDETSVRRQCLAKLQFAKGLHPQSLAFEFAGTNLVSGLSAFACSGRSPVHALAFVPGGPSFKPVSSLPAHVEAPEETVRKPGCLSEREAT
jgi:hypothetical protein